jgi:hypothetical protein
MDAPAKQQIVERVKQAENILVTVSNDPSVDQLAACIGLTLLLNKMGKHATAVFSGKAPSTIEFLQPEKTLETNTDSLRDFIISLDKNKADKLRYKVEDQVVRIFITPYRTSLSEKDLVFSQGDFNVEVVMALGIKDRTQIDAAIAAHGRILHDATVVSVNAGQGGAPDTGQINWQDPTASSLCEMLVSISEAFAPGLIDNQMATAFLTGIVAETNRFSNKNTSPRTMTISAQLMAAGANQQLIATKLEPPPLPAPKKPQAKPKPPEPPKNKAELEAKVLQERQGILNVEHGREAPKESPEVQVSPNEIRIDEEGNITTAKDMAFQEKKTEIAKPEQPEEKSEPEKPSPPLPNPGPAKTLVNEVKPFAPVPSVPQESDTTKESETPRVSGRMPSSRPTLPTQPVTDEYKPHVLMDPLNQPPSLEAPFTADTGHSAWADSYNSVPFDPLSPAGLKDEGFRGDNVKTVTPPSVQPNGLMNIDSIRKNVESAYAGAPETYEAPRADLNAQFGPEIEHQPRQPTDNGATPSLQLPTNGTQPPPMPPPIDRMLPK